MKCNPARDMGHTRHASVRFRLEYIECAGHGSCNRFNGSCVCDRGYYGAACESNLDLQVIVLHTFRGFFSFHPK